MFLSELFVNKSVKTVLQRRVISLECPVKPVKKIAIVCDILPKTINIYQMKKSLYILYLYDLHDVLNGADHDNLLH